MKQAFSLIELVFVIAIIGVISSIAVPKFFATRETAEIVKLKEELEAVRKGIEAYAGNEYLEKGAKTYPTSLCNATSTCDISSSLFGFLTTVNIPHRNTVKSGRNFVFWGAGKEILIMKDYKVRTGYAFSYDNLDGKLTCTNINKDGYKSLPCKDLGE